MLIDIASAVAWSGAGRTTASPVLVHSVSAAVTAVFITWLMWVTRRLPPSTEVRRRAARLLVFTPRGDRPSEPIRDTTVTTIALLAGLPGGGGHLSERTHEGPRLHRPDRAVLRRLLALRQGPGAALRRP